ncbi:MAG TPA: hypothetical protein VFS43_07090 [Polyangiaceae bacterium]|nr:hypothetical protein [Polyangiaceae bacterium]
MPQKMMASAEARQPKAQAMKPKVAVKRPRSRPESAFMYHFSAGFSDAKSQPVMPQTGGGL